MIYDKETLRHYLEEDRKAFLTIFTKENVLRELDSQGVFTITYRLVDTGEPSPFCITLMKHLPAVEAVFKGLRPAVVALIAAAVIKMARNI